jgi:hypothetical protein
VPKQGPNHISMIFCFLILEVKYPFSILGAEIDKLTSPELIKQFNNVLSANSGVCSHFQARPLSSTTELAIFESLKC